MKIEIETEDDAKWFNDLMKTAPQPIKGMTLEITTKVPVDFPGTPDFLYLKGVKFNGCLGVETDEKY